MASFSFDQAVLRLTFETGIDEFGKSTFTYKTYRNLRSDVEADEIVPVVLGINSLTENTLTNVQKLQTDSIHY